MESSELTAAAGARWALSKLYFLFLFRWNFKFHEYCVLFRAHHACSNQIHVVACIWLWNFMAPPPCSTFESKLLHICVPHISHVHVLFLKLPWFQGCATAWTEHQARIKIFPQIALFRYLLSMMSPCRRIQNWIQSWSMASQRSCCDVIFQGHRSPLAGAFAFEW